MLDVSRVCVVGLGLMGASLAAALRGSGFGGSVVGCARRVEAIEAGLERGWLDEGCTDMGAAVAEADVVVFCLPVEAIAEQVEALVELFKVGAVVTDVGSTKGMLAERLGAALEGSGVEFVGSHPICGSERRGFEAVDEALYTGRLAVVCGDEGASRGAVKVVHQLWEQVGCEVVSMGAGEHDEVLATTSHLPHLAAALVVRSVVRGDVERVADFCGTGFRDTTRVASGSAAVWADIVLSNRGALSGVLDSFERELGVLRELVASGDRLSLEKWFSEASSGRDELVERSRFLS